MGSNQDTENFNSVVERKYLSMSYTSSADCWLIVSPNSEMVTHFLLCYSQTYLAISLRSFRKRG